MESKWEKVNNEHVIHTDKGVLYYWRDNDYERKRRKGMKKKEINKETLKVKIDEIARGSTIFHQENGAPILQSDLYKEISISHSDAFFCLYFSDHSVGVDIQVLKKNLYDGRAYFVNQREEEKIDLSELNLHLIWSAKEAFYKLLKGDILNLKEEAVITEINLIEKSIFLEYHQDKFELNFLLREEFVLVWI